MRATNYDYIFLGAGCASLSIIMRMIAAKEFEHKKILLVEKEQKTKNDRTWCFWEEKAGFFEDIVYQKWDNLLFKTDGVSIPLEIGSYQYKMIRGIDFYSKCFASIAPAKNIDIIYGEISFEENNGLFKLKINKETLEYGPKTLLFNSLYIPPVQQEGKFYLLQHFKGWIIETPGNSFAGKHATLMDFRVSQSHGTTFVYVLPLSPTKALVEYTLFTESLLPAAEYTEALKNYVGSFLNIEAYSIVEEEFGVIPMINADFPFFKRGMYHIGTAGGQTKPSTGYTFNFIQKQADKIVEELIATGKLSKYKN